MTTIAFFSNRSGVGKTTLVYHLAHMASRLGYSVLLMDLDPQANLTSAFLDEQRIERLWDDEATISSAVEPALDASAEVRSPRPVEVADDLWLVPGDLALSRFEDRLSEHWARCEDGDEDAVGAITALPRATRQAAASIGANVVFLDVGSNLGALSRSALLAADRVCIPMAADLFSVRGLASLGPTLRAWRQSRMEDADAAAGEMRPVGYLVRQHAIRLDQPGPSDRWRRRIPAEFRRWVLDSQEEAPPADEDPYRLASLRSYRSLMPLAQDARKPMFDLRAADGALGSTGRFVETCEREFRELTRIVLRATGITA